MFLLEKIAFSFSPKFPFSINTSRVQNGLTLKYVNGCAPLVDRQLNSSPDHCSNSSNKTHLSLSHINRKTCSDIKYHFLLSFHFRAAMTVTANVFCSV